MTHKYKERQLLEPQAKFNRDTIQSQSHTIRHYCSIDATIVQRKATLRTISIHHSNCRQKMQHLIGTQLNHRETTHKLLSINIAGNSASLIYVKIITSRRLSINSNTCNSGDTSFASLMESTVNIEATLTGTQLHHSYCRQRSHI